MPSLNEYPEYREVAGQLLDKLLNESGRGAILIGTSHVDEHLTMLIEAVFPSNRKVYKNRLLKYPGPISSFSAKIELAYAFRLIDETLYNSLNALRKIRNEAAHSSSAFDLVDIAEKIKLVYSLGPGVPDVIKRRATEIMVTMKFENINRMFDENKVEDEIRKQVITDLLNDKDSMGTLEKQAPHWELICGLSLICGFIAHEKDSVLTLAKKGGTWVSIIGEAHKGE